MMFLENAAEILKNNTKISLSPNNMVIKNHRSGASLPNMVFTLRNKYDDILTLEDPSLIISTALTITVDSSNPISSQYYIRGDAFGRYVQNKKWFEFVNLDFIGKPETSIDILLKSDLIKIVDETTNQFLNTYSYKISV